MPPSGAPKGPFGAFSSLIDPVALRSFDRSSSAVYHVAIRLLKPIILAGDWVTTTIIPCRPHHSVTT